MKNALDGPRFAVVGVAGYVARRHLDAIRRVGGDIVAGFDVFDSVGQMNDFTRARFFTDFAEFASYLEAAKRVGRQVDYVVICSPNYLHRPHMEFALRLGANAICEKPLVLNPSDLDDIEQLESVTGKRVYTILQLRLNADNQRLKQEFDDLRRSGSPRVDGHLTYITARSQWYYASWKGDERRSGGVSTNIGVHFFDLLTYFFGRPVKNTLHHRAIDCATGSLEFDHARITWFLSINSRDLPPEAREQNQLNKATRRLVMGTRICDLSGDFTELHTASYKEIIAGRGFVIEQARPAIEIVSEIRSMPLAGLAGDSHPMLERTLADKDRYEDGIPV